jgi:hypothetical protein
MVEGRPPHPSQDTRGPMESQDLVLIYSR